MDIATFASDAISTLASFSFDSVYIESPRTRSAYTRYIPLTGTISSSANTITGTGTNFVTEFPVGTNLLVNNELFIVKSVANSTYMTINVNPTAPLVGATGYRVPIPTYSFSSVPTSIDENANGTFNVATTFVDSGTRLYWTIDNVTTNSGDFT